MLSEPRSARRASAAWLPTSGLLPQPRAKRYARARTSYEARGAEGGAGENKRLGRREAHLGRSSWTTQSTCNAQAADVVVQSAGVVRLLLASFGFTRLPSTNKTRRQYKCPSC